jgi:Kdo2-lipid IVA lauroyltransferase/acyltransferase
MNLFAYGVLALVRALHVLPMPVLDGLGRALGALLHAFARRRRRIANRNVELCLPELGARERQAIVREHFRWLGRSIVERSLLWHASADRLRAMMTIEGDVHLAERTAGPVMWLVPHFVALEVAAIAAQLHQQRPAATIYKSQSNPVFDAAMRAGRRRFADSLLLSRQDGAKPLIRAIKQEGRVFFNLPDMDFGLKDAAFVPFFGQPAATLLAPSRMARMLDMVVQPIVAEMTPSGWHVRFEPAWTDWPSDDAQADALRMNRWIESQVRRMPAQYWWVHQRFKTRPEGMGSVYD